MSQRDPASTVFSHNKVMESLNITDNSQEMEQQNTFVFSHLCLVHVKHIKNSYSWISLTKQGGILENFKKLKKTEKEQALKTTFYFPIYFIYSNTLVHSSPHLPVYCLGRWVRLHCFFYKWEY